MEFIADFLSLFFLRKTTNFNELTLLIIIFSLYCDWSWARRYWYVIYPGLYQTDEL